MLQIIRIVEISLEIFISDDCRTFHLCHLKIAEFDFNAKETELKRGSFAFNVHAKQVQTNNRNDGNYRLLSTMNWITNRRQIIVFLSPKYCSLHRFTSVRFSTFLYSFASLVDESQNVIQCTAKQASMFTSIGLLFTVTQLVSCDTRPLLNNYNLIIGAHANRTRQKSKCRERNRNKNAHEKYGKNRRRF